MKKFMLFLFVPAICLALDPFAAPEPEKKRLIDDPLQSPSQPPKPKRERPKLVIPKTVPKEVDTEAENLFVHPGVVTLRDGTWTGSDNFVNISKNIGIVVTFEGPKGHDYPFTEEDVHSVVEGVLDKGGISPHALAGPGKPPLPILNILVLIYPLKIPTSGSYPATFKEGYVVSCKGRLFEEVRLDRVNLSREAAFQAITWEHEKLVIGPKNEFNKMLLNAVDEITSNFVKRIAAYQTPATQ